MPVHMIEAAKYKTKVLPGEGGKKNELTSPVRTQK